MNIDKDYIQIFLYFFSLQLHLFALTDTPGWHGSPPPEKGIQCTTRQERLEEQAGDQPR